MAKIKFYYRSQKDIAPLTLRFGHKGVNTSIDYFINSTVIIPKSYIIFEEKKNKKNKTLPTVVKSIKSTTHATRNARTNIQDLEHHILTEFGKANSLGVIFSKDWFINEIEKHFKRTTTDTELNFLEYYLHYIEKHKTTPCASTGKPLALSTLKTYKSAYSIIKLFNDNNYELNYENITTDFYEDFISFLYEKDYSNNYIGAQIKTLKTIMNASFEDNLHSNLDYKKRAFKKPLEEVFNIYLTPEELEKIYTADTDKFKPTKKTKEKHIYKSTLELTRDIFLIGAYTGLRVSDLNQLNEENIVTIEGKQHLKIKTQKTGKIVTIPISPIVREIFKKHDNKPPKRLNAQKMNLSLKELGKLAEINGIIEFEKSKGGLIIKKNLHKYEMIGNHTSRRSFCTNAYKSEMPVIDIMAISTHKSERSFFNYIKITDEEQALKIGKHKFFNEPLLKSI